MATQDWRAIALQAVTELLTSELAVLKHEIEAKVSEEHLRPGFPKPEPHHITNALKTLISQGFLVAEADRTRGGREISLLRVADTHRRARKVAAAASRKRLLQARYLGWASGSKSGGVGIVGPALESVVHQSLIEAAPWGYRLLKPEGGEVQRVFGTPVPYGPLDNAALVTVLDNSTPSTSSYLIPIEAKNLRSWIYPAHEELHQLLAKAAALQAENPTLSVMPILVCRRAHQLTFRMAKALGFYIIETRRQYIRPHVIERDATALQEVVTELGYGLEPHDLAVPEMVKQFKQTVPRYLATGAKRWAQVAEPCREAFADLRKDLGRGSERKELLDELAELAASAMGERQTWRSDLSGGPALTGLFEDGPGFVGDGPDDFD